MKVIKAIICDTVESIEHSYKTEIKIKSQTNLKTEI